MATEKTQEWQDATNDAAANAVEDGWQSVSEESQIVLEQVGDGFIGTYVRKDPPTGAGIIQLHFENVTNLNGDFITERAFLNGTRDLVNKLYKVPFMRQVRAQWTSNLNTGQITPMRVFSVQWR